MSWFPFRARRLLRQMWFLPAVFCAAAIGMIALAHYSAFLLPDKLPFDVSSSAIEDILSIVAASMLSVAVFSLATMVNALSAASQTATPRAVRLIAEDRTAQTSISIFVGAFLFSIVGIIGISGGLYTASGRLILFAAAIVVVAVVVGALIRWINLISSIGRVGETISRAEAAANEAFDELARRPGLGCREAAMPPPGAVPVQAHAIGYVQHLEPARLQEVAADFGVLVHVAARPGTFVTPIRPLAFVVGPMSEEAATCIRATFVVGDERTFDHDPRFGLIVLSEIASRALSPAVNDPGTAIAIIHTVVRIVGRWVGACPNEEPPSFENLSVAPLSARDLIDDAFRPIVRDGSDKVEVCLRLVNALAAIRALSPDLLGPAATRMLGDLLERARATMSHPADLQAVEDAASAVAHAPANAGGGMHAS